VALHGTLFFTEPRDVTTKQICSGVCCVWFDQATKERQRIEDISDSEDSDDEDIGDTGSTPDDIVGEGKPDSNDQGTDGLRNVRWAVDQAEVSSDGSASQTGEARDLEEYAQSLAQQHREAMDGSRLYDAVQEIFADHGSPTATDRYALQDYQMQLMLLEQQNKKRALMARQNYSDTIQSGFDGQRNIVEISPRPSIPAAKANHSLQDYQMQMMLLEQQNKKRLLMARQEYENMAEQEEGPVQSSSKLRAAMSYRRADGTQRQRHAAPKLAQEGFADIAPSAPSKKRAYHY
jgi:hypothetical protein